MKRSTNLTRPRDMKRPPIRSAQCALSRLLAALCASVRCEGKGPGVAVTRGLQRRTGRRLVPVAFSVLSMAATASMAAEREGRLRLAAAQSAAAAHLTPRAVAECLAAEFVRRDRIPADYTNDLTLEALLLLDDVTGERKYWAFVQKILDERGLSWERFPAYQSQPFNCITFALLERTRDPRYFGPFVAEMNKYRHGVPRAFDGAVSHYGDPHMGRILIDQLQDYSARMARAGWLSGDSSYFDEAVAQYGLFRTALRDPKTGLWAHGRGWFDNPRYVTAIAWGRGQGWLLRGFVETLAYLPADSDWHRQMQDWLRELAEALLTFQQADGMWRQVVDRPDSFPETSSTALCVHYFARAIRQGDLPEQPYRQAAVRAYEALLANSISADGKVYLTCMGTGPQRSLEDYLRRESPVNDQHGIATCLLACSGRMLLDGKARIIEPLPQQAAQNSPGGPTR